jgi:prolyl 4-hydroxylase
VYAGHFDFTQRLVWSIAGFFSADECAAVRRAADAGEWLAGTVNSAEGRVVDPKVRDSSTAILRDAGLADRAFERARPELPARLRLTGEDEVGVVGLNVPLRVYRYQPGQHFGPHRDQFYAGAGGTRSLLTFMVYLNDDFEGGATSFPEQGKRVVPRAGDALVFQHMVLHAGERVASGVKYVLRSEVLYRPLAR